MRVRGRSDGGQVNIRWTSGESQSELDSVGRETCSWPVSKVWTSLWPGLDFWAPHSCQSWGRPWSHCERSCPNPKPLNEEKFIVTAQARVCTSMSSLLSLSPGRSSLKCVFVRIPLMMQSLVLHFQCLIPNWIQGALDGLCFLLLTSSRVSLRGQLDLILVQRNLSMTVQFPGWPYLHIRVTEAIRIHRNKVTSLKQLEHRKI